MAHRPPNVTAGPGDEVIVERAARLAAESELAVAREKLARLREVLENFQLQLIDADKLMGVGRLAAGVAHEVKNPLAVLSMGIEYLEGRYGADEATAAALREMSDAVARADGVIKGLLDYSAPHRLETAPQDLNALVRTALRLVRGEIRRDAHAVTLELGPLPPACVDRSKTIQVLVNLLSNALQAMPDGGELGVRTWAEGPEIVLEVADTGPGIPEHVLPRVFEPFFTTKPAGKGNGLGMSVVRSIMKLQGGHVRLANRPDGGGAVATLTFPANPNFP